MVSDQAQALERDNVFGPSKDKNTMTVREPEDDPDDLVPVIMTKGTDVKEFPTDFFLVSLAYGQPADTTDHSILKIYEFPVMNRESPATPAEFSGYLKKYASDPSEKQFANFQLLLYLAEFMDMDTALNVAHNVANETALDPALLDLFKSM